MELPKSCSVGQSNTRFQIFRSVWLPTRYIVSVPMLFVHRVNNMI